MYQRIFYPVYIIEMVINKATVILTGCGEADYRKGSKVEEAKHAKEFYQVHRKGIIFCKGLHLKRNQKDKINYI